MLRFAKRAAAVVLCCAAVAAAKPVPDIKLQDLAGHAQRLGSLRGSVTVISFWATWCVPCREELPRLSALKERYAAQGVRFVAVSVDEAKDRGKIEPFLRERGISLESWIGADLDTLDRLALGNVLPATIILDKDGEAVGRIMGEARDADVTDTLDWLLHDRQGARPAAVIKRY